LRPAVLAALTAHLLPEAAAADVEEGITVLADPQMLDRALRALIGAAAVDGGDGPVVVGAVQRNDEVVVVVSRMLRSGLERLAIPSSLRELVETLGGRVWSERRGVASGLVAALPAPSRTV
jgi:vacuolar-type H+-ATPase subunit E/Vma4